MFGFKDARYELALEYRANPFGEHSPDLQYLLNLMRRPTHESFHVLIVERPGDCWRLGIMTPGSNAPPKPTNILFNTLEEAEWHVFSLRWSMLASSQPPLVSK